MAAWVQRVAYIPRTRPEALLFPTPRERMLNGQGRPYFLWDTDMTLSAFEEHLTDPDPEVRG